MPTARNVRRAVLAILSATYAQRSTLLQDVRVIDGSGKPPMEHADLLIDHDRICAIAAHGKVIISSRVVKIDCAGMSVMPGLISNHSHLGQG